MATVTEKSSTGLDANLAALLCYAAGWITGIVFFVLEKDSKFVKFHAMQSIVVFLSLTVFWYVLVWIPFIGWLFFFLSPIVFLLSLVLWILLMVKAYNGEKFKLPIAGDIAEQQAAK
jgi:uncharacterized membrane protein